MRRHTYSLFTVLCGRPPFLGKSTEEVVALVTSGRHVAPQQVEPLAPSELCAVVERALRVNKAERYPSVREFAADVIGAGGTDESVTGPSTVEK